MKIDASAEDLSTPRHISQAAPDDDDDDHDDHDDNDKINDTEGVDPERLKAFNVSQQMLHFGTSSSIRTVLPVKAASIS